MAPRGLDGSGGRFDGAERRSKLTATPGKVDLGILHHELGLAPAAVRSQRQKNRTRPASEERQKRARHRGTETGGAR